MVVLWATVALASSIEAPSAVDCGSRSAKSLTKQVERATGAERRAAAICLLDRHPEAASASIDGWMADADAAELAHLVADRLDTLPIDVAVGAASAGVRGPHADWFVPVVWRSEVPMVRAVLAQDGDE
jgi:hypothetical protein